MSYDLLKNRLTNGTPFLRASALERINALADALEITQNQADELTAIATENGVDVLPDDATARLERIERTLDALMSVARESTLLKAIAEKIDERLEGGA